MNNTKKKKPHYRATFSFLAESMGFDSRLRAQSGSALTAHRAVIHYRAASNPIAN